MPQISHLSMSQLIVILPKEKADIILDQSLPYELKSTVLINARGTVFKDKWYQWLKPSISPEQMIAEVLLPSESSQKIMVDICKAADLYGKGMGIVYTIPCDKVIIMSKNEINYNLGTDSEDAQHKKNIKVITCVIQKSKAEEVAIAAIRAGAHGPTITYGKGKGLREKLGLIRIAINPEKEFIRVVVDDYNFDAVLEAMVTTAKIDTPGMGFIHSVEADQALINVKSVATGKFQLAHQYHVIKAIDELTGGVTWRSGGGSNAEILPRKYLYDLVKVSCIVDRGTSNDIIQPAMDAGASGASISYGWINNDDKDNHFIGNREVEVIDMVVSQEVADTLIEMMTLYLKDKEACIYVQNVTKAYTYT